MSSFFLSIGDTAILLIGPATDWVWLFSTIEHWIHHHTYVGVTLIYLFFFALTSQFSVFYTKLLRLKQGNDAVNSFHIFLSGVATYNLYLDICPELLISGGNVFWWYCLLVVAVCVAQFCIEFSLQCLGLTIGWMQIFLWNLECCNIANRMGGRLSFCFRFTTLNSSSCTA